MASDYFITIMLDDEKVKKLDEAGMAKQITEEGGGKAIKVALPEKNKRKFSKAFPKTVLNDQTGKVEVFPEEAANLLFDAIIEYKTLDVMQFFLMKAFKPLAGKELRRAIH